MSIPIKAIYKLKSAPAVNKMFVTHINASAEYRPDRKSMPTLASVMRCVLVHKEGTDQIDIDKIIVSDLVYEYGQG